MSIDTNYNKTDPDYLKSLLDEIDHKKIYQDIERLTYSIQKSLAELTMVTSAFQTKIGERIRVETAEVENLKQIAKEIKLLPNLNENKEGVLSELTINYIKAFSSDPKIIHKIGIFEIENIIIDYFTLSDLLLSVHSLGGKKVEKAIQSKKLDEIKDFINNSICHVSIDHKTLELLITTFKQYATCEQIKLFYQNFAWDQIRKIAGPLFRTMNQTDKLDFPQIVQRINDYFRSLEVD